MLADHGAVLTEVASRIAGQLVAVRPAHEQIGDGFAPGHVRSDPKARRARAEEQLRFAARASRRRGTAAPATSPALFPGPAAIVARSGRRC